VLEKTSPTTERIDWHRLHRPNFGNMTIDQGLGIPEILLREPMPVASARGALR
jgi:hypothetical protein